MVPALGPSFARTSGRTPVFPVMTRNGPRLLELFSSTYKHEATSLSSTRDPIHFAVSWQSSFSLAHRGEVGRVLAYRISYVETEGPKLFRSAFANVIDNSNILLLVKS